MQWPVKNQPRCFVRTASVSAFISASVVLGACTPFGPTALSKSYHAPREKVALTKAQNCAIGYDLARQVYKIVEVKKTVITVSPDLGRCGKHAVGYLRKAGFAVDETQRRGSNAMFAIQTFEDKEQKSIFATAHLPGVKITRAYKRGQGGVYPLSPFNITQTGAVN